MNDKTPDRPVAAECEPPRARRQSVDGRETQAAEYACGTFLLALMLLLLLFTTDSVGASLPVSRQEPARSGNPHGNIRIPCQNCHTTEGWLPLRPVLDFNHNNTRYPLRGVHADLGCRQCHIKLTFTTVGMQCADCHADIHRRQLGSNCEQCHDGRGWRVSLKSVQNHQNRFPLIGVHAAVGCESCHKSAAVSQFRGLSTECVSCHLSDYEAAKSVDHKAAGFSLSCGTCHGMDGWVRGFDHGRFTGFDLHGAHSQLACRECHAGGQFAGLPATCSACHLPAYNATTAPNHRNAGFPQECSICHNDVHWLPAAVNHDRTRFPLTGAHTTVPCNSCHISGVFTGTPGDCYSCHSKEFGTVTNPNHNAAGFPRDCSLCHSTSRWSGAVFNHTKFPIYSGSHAQKWTTCGDCHTNASNYLVFSCITCHEHAKTNTDQEHREVANYVYNSVNCYACHPTGRGD